MIILPSYHIITSHLRTIYRRRYFGRLHNGISSSSSCNDGSNGSNNVDSRQLKIINDHPRWPSSSVNVFFNVSPEFGVYRCQGRVEHEVVKMAERKNLATVNTNFQLCGRCTWLQAEILASTILYPN